jgi:Zn ribbon nucleic-acid-binding protein
MAEETCIFPPCPKCKEGYLVPFSFKEDVFEKWKCTKCGYEVTKRQKDF